jgi:hypothetical protein
MAPAKRLPSLRDPQKHGQHDCRPRTWTPSADDGQFGNSRRHKFLENPDATGQAQFAPKGTPQAIIDKRNAARTATRATTVLCGSVRAAEARKRLRNVDQPILNTSFSRRIDSSISVRVGWQ